MSWEELGVYEHEGWITVIWRDVDRYYGLQWSQDLRYLDLLHKGDEDHDLDFSLDHAINNAYARILRDHNIDSDDWIFTIIEHSKLGGDLSLIRSDPELYFTRARL